MEADGERNQHSQDDKSSRRKIKTPTQLETLEKVFAEEQYPSETVRAELSAQIGLSDRQLQVWFCHRRLKDRKVKDDEGPVSVKKKKQEKVGALEENSGAVLASEHTDSTLPGGKYYANDCTTTSNSFAQEGAANQSRKQAGKRGGKENEKALGKKFQQVISKDIDPRRAAELRAISAVEAQLGELLREDCPVLGVEFDGLPSGAFMAPLQSYEEMQTSLQCDNKASERHEMKARKNIRDDQYASNESGHGKATLSGSFDFDDQQVPRTLQEYKFIPEQPTRRPEHSQPRDKSTQSKFYLGADSPFQSLPSTGSFLHGSDALMTAFGFQGRVGTGGGGLLPQLDGCANFLFPQSGMNFEGMHQDGFPGFGYDSQFAPHRSSLQLLSGGVSFLGSEKLTLLHEQEQAKLEKKRKNEEAKIAKEVEAHEKRIRREIERQDIARRKREEQIRKELEKQDREKRREEERVSRDRQREEERIQREHRREIERREKIMEKETRRVEQQQRKDESRRQKEFAKLKVSSERAIARRLARDSSDLIDDERLELLEAAAVAQGLPSIYMLDGSTLNELDRYTEFLKKFPPASVRMKKPLSVHPWIDSRVIVGNLLMVWRFLNTFADVLGLWPFTVDELVQAFHDYDPRLLGEIHMALLKIVVKDIEDVAQASFAGMAANQYALGFSGGGHPLLVEAAFAWGFDIREWRQHLNPLTWPEVLRQFALSAGYGPKWKKHDIEVDHPRDDAEGNEAEDVVNTLRSGVAVENAVSQMRGKGGQGRRRRHRLTPGTVKFAAFHVLSVAGDNGLTILEVAERIQKSGLRDLSTSKTPEASIAAALSRDARLFVRVAPSTYCVRSPFRKDPEDAEHILQVARDKVRLFQNVTPDAEDPEKETEFVDEAEREEDTDEDLEDIEGDEAEEILTEGQNSLCISNVEELKSGVSIGIDKGQRTGDIDINRQSMVSDDIHLVQESTTDVKLGIIDVTDFGHPGEGAAILKDEHLLSGFPEETEIDESSAGEPWVQGLMEGDYCDLSIEERLNALVALVDVVNEGNTFRGALEERLEAANSLKRQIWAEAQLDRRRFKEEQLMKMQNLDEGFKTEATNNSIEGRHESPVGETEKCAGATDLKGGLMLDRISTQADPGSELGAVEKIIYRQGAPQEGLSVPQPGSVTDKSRAQLKADIGLKAEELYVYRCLPLGFDRRHNRYWQFVTCNNGQDPGCGRIYFESAVDAQWHVIDMEESFDALMASLDTRGTREANLHGVLQKYESFLRDGMRKAHVRKCRASVAEMKANGGQFQVECSRNDEFTHNSGYASEEGSSAGGVVAPGGDLSGDAGAIFIQCNASQVERESALERYLEFDRWLWKKCMKGDFCLNASKFGRKRCLDVLSSCEICHEFNFPREKHCSHCHTTIEGPGKLEAKISQHLLECNEKRRKRESNWRFQMPPKSLPSRIQLLRAEILTVEVHIPLEALKSTWTDERRKAWASMVKHASSSAELLQLVTELEAVVHRDWLSPSYETTDEILRTASEGSSLAQDFAVVGESSVLPWVPQTTAAVALRLAVLDAALSYSLDQKQQKLKHMDKKDSMKTANNEPATTKAQEVKAEDESSSEERNDDGSTDVCKQPSSQKRGRGGRLRGRGRGRGSSSRSVAVSDVTKGSKGKVKSSDLPAVDDQQVEKVAKGSRGRGGLGRGSGRGRGVRGGGRGRGRGRGRGNGCGRGRVRGRGRGTSSTAQGCGPSSGSGSSRHSPVVRRQQKRAKMSMSARKKKNASRQVAEEEQEQSEDDSAQNGDWEDQNFESENEEDKHYNEYEEENALCSSEENAPDCSEEQDEDEPDQEEEHMSVDNSYDEKRQSEADDFEKQEDAEDSVDEEQGEGVLTEREEDEEEGENDDGSSQSDTSQESESG